jgi:hypothetical protein
VPAVKDRDGRSVLPSWLLPPTLGLAIWTGVAPFVLSDASTADRQVIGTVPAAVIVLFTLADYLLWRRRQRPWHDWLVIVLLLPAIGAAVWIGVGALVLNLGLSREELLGGSVGPGVALVGLLCTTISYHGRHHPDEARR